MRRLEETVRVLTVGLLATHGLTYMTPEEKRKLQRLKELQRSFPAKYIGEPKAIS